MDSSRFVYVAYISASPEKIWNAFIIPAITAEYWQHENMSDWKPGSGWAHLRMDRNRTRDIVGKVVEYSRPRRLVLTWAAPEDEDNEAKHSRVTLEISPYHGVSRVTVTHEELEASSGMLEAVAAGWPMVLSSLKSMLETGKPLPELWDDADLKEPVAAGKAARP